MMKTMFGGLGGLRSATEGVDEQGEEQETHESIILGRSHSHWTVCHTSASSAEGPYIPGTGTSLTRR